MPGIPRSSQHRMYPGKAVRRSPLHWALVLLSAMLGIYLGLIVGIATESLILTLLAGLVVAFLTGAYYSRKASVIHRVDVLQRALGPDYYRFEISMEWPIDGLIQFIVDRLTAAGFNVFPIASEFVDIPKDSIARFRYGYVFGPINKQLLVLQTLDAPHEVFQAMPPVRMSYIIVVRPFERRASPHDDPVVRTVGQLLWEFELVRLRKGFPPTVPLRKVSVR